MAYKTIWEHLTDELKLMDLLMQRELLRQRAARPPHPLDQFKGLVLSDQEISDLLGETSEDEQREGRGPADEESLRLLSQSINALASGIRRKTDESLRSGHRLPLVHLSSLFRLTPFEERCLILCLAPELNRKYEKLYAFFQDDLTQKSPTVDLALALLCSSIEERLSARLSFDPQAPLVKHGLLQVSDGTQQEIAPPLLSRALKLDDRIVNFLLGVGLMDHRLGALAHFDGPMSAGDSTDRQGELQGGLRGRTQNEAQDEKDAGETVEAPAEMRARMTAFLRAHYEDAGREGQRPLVFYLHGPEGSGKKGLAREVCAELGVTLLVSDLRQMLHAERPFEESIRLLGREALLQGTPLCLEHFDALRTADERYHARLRALHEALVSQPQPVFILARESGRPQELPRDCIVIPIAFRAPDEDERKRFWEGLLREHGMGGQEGLDAGALASKFRFTHGRMREAFSTARQLSRWRSPERSQLTTEDLHEACRAQSDFRLKGLARKVEGGATWKDLCLPADQLSQLREICSQARYRYLVLGEWGFGRKLSYGKGLNVLFSGPPGTGKTMSAEVIGNELQLDLYKIDLSQVVSKYIGETEKNLQQIFDEAQTSNAILFFDEADALFGKRSEVKDAHDRYANIEIGYLLQRMEEYEGIAILATNLRQNLDEAFVRRMHVIVEFPFPDEEYRRRIWEVIFPANAPLGPDVDFRRLAAEIRLAGGNIKNIALAAAFHAAQNGSVINSEHLSWAARREYQKLGRTWDAPGSSSKTS